MEVLEIHNGVLRKHAKMSSFDMTYMKILSFGRCIRGCLLVDFVLSLTNLLLKTEDKRLTGILQRMTMTHYWSTEPVWISIGHSPAREMQGRIEYFDKKYYTIMFRIISDIFIL